MSTLKKSFATAAAGNGKKSALRTAIDGVWYPAAAGPPTNHREFVAFFDRALKNPDHTPIYVVDMLYPRKADAQTITRAFIETLQRQTDLADPEKIIYLSKEMLRNDMLREGPEFTASMRRVWQTLFQDASLEKMHSVHDVAGHFYKDILQGLQDEKDKALRRIAADIAQKYIDGAPYADIYGPLYRLRASDEDKKFSGPKSYLALAVEEMLPAMMTRGDDDNVIELLSILPGAHENIRQKIGPDYALKIVQKVMGEASALYEKQDGWTSTDYERLNYKISNMDDLITALGPQPAPHGQTIAAARNKLVDKIFTQNAARLLEVADVEDYEYTRGELVALMKSLRPGPALMTTCLRDHIDRLINDDRYDWALAFATDTCLRAECALPDILTPAQHEKMLQHFEDRNDMASRARLLGDAAGQPEATPTEILQNFAPILGDHRDDPGLVDFINALSTTPHSTIAKAQADDLQYVWDALGKADPDLAVLAGDDTGPYAMTPDGLHSLSLAVSANMNVVQTQRPVLYPQGKSLHNIHQQIEDVLTTHAQQITVNPYDVRGGRIEVLRNDEEQETYDTGFGFLLACKTEQKTIDGLPVSEEKLLAMPTIGIDRTLLRTTRAHGGEGVLSSLQDIMGILNHDYFHHFTARIIGPYFGGAFMSSGIDLAKTPYGMLMGEEIDPPGKYGRVLGAEKYTTFYHNRYSADHPTWPKFAQQSANYEYHALHLHKALYEKYLDDGPAGTAMRAAIDRYGASVRTLGDNMRAAGLRESTINDTKCYYANMLCFHLRRVVPHDHPLARHGEAAIDAMQIDADHSRALLRASVNNLRDGNYDRRLENIRGYIGVDHDAPETLSPAQIARWQGARMAVNVLNMLYMDKYADARAKALPALRESLSVVAQDIQTLSDNGGRPAFDDMQLHQARETRAAVSPPPMTKADDRALRLVRQPA